MNMRRQIRSDFDALTSELGRAGKLSEAIRTTVMLNPEASDADIIAALPGINPKTIKREALRSRKYTKEMDDMAKKKVEAPAPKKEAPAPKVKKMTQEEWDALSVEQQRKTPYGIRPPVRPELNLVTRDEWQKQFPKFKGMTLEDAARYGVVVGEAAPSAAGKKEKAAGTKTGRARVAAPSIEEIEPGLVAKIAKTYEKNAKGGACAALRAVGAAFPDVHHRVIAAALPALNPSTVSIQVKKGRS